MFTRFSGSLFFWKFMARWITRPGESRQMYQTYWFDLLVAALAFAAFAFLAACTLRSFRSLQIAADHARRGIAAGCAAYLTLLFPLPLALANAGFGILPGLLALLRMAVLVGGQLIVEHVYSYSVPVSVFITVGGGLYFLYLLLTRKKV